MGQGCQNGGGHRFRLECMQLFVALSFGVRRSCSRVICVSICCRSNVLAVIFRSNILCSLVILMLSQFAMTCGPCNKVKYGNKTGVGG